MALSDRIKAGLLLPALAATLGAALSVLGVTGLISDHIPLMTRTPVMVEKEADRAETEKIKQQIAALKALQNRWTELSRDRSPTALRIDALDQRVAAVEKRMQKLEEVLGTAPEKALALPLMRRDLDAQKEVSGQSILAIQSSIDHLYDLTYTFLGGIGLTIFGLGISAFISKKSLSGID